MGVRCITFLFTQLYNCLHQLVNLNVDLIIHMMIVYGIDLILQLLVPQALEKVSHLKPNEVEVFRHLWILSEVSKLSIIGLDDLGGLVDLLVGVSFCGFYVFIFHTLIMASFVGTVNAKGYQRTL